MQLFLHRQLDAELADAFVQLVPACEVLVLRLGSDATHVADDVAGERRVRVDAARLLEDLHTGKVFDSFEDRRRGGLVDVLGHRHRQERAVHLAVEARLHVFDRHVDPTGQTPEDLGTVAVSSDDIPVDGNRQDALVVGEDPTFGIEDPSPFGQKRNRPTLGLLDLFLEAGLLDGLQEPQARADEAEQHRPHESEHAEARGAFVESHSDSLPVTQPSCRSWTRELRSSSSRGAAPPRWRDRRIRSAAALRAPSMPGRGS